MKRIILLIAIYCLAGFIAVGQIRYQQNYSPQSLSNVNLRLETNLPFQISFDGIAYNTTASSQKIQHIQPGRHFLQVYALYFNGYTQQRQLIYNGAIYVPDATELYAIINRNNGLIIENQIALNNFNNYPYLPQEPVLEAYQPNPQRDYPRPCGRYSMDDDDFAQLRSMMERASFESAKLAIAKQALNANVFTARQVVCLLNTFSFESTKLEFAKMAYNKTVDKNNYYLVNDAFYFSSSITDLQQYLAIR